MKTILIRNGQIATAEGVYPGDILCSGETIAEVAPTGSIRDADEVVDADGMFVLPGGIDVHTHFDEPFMGCVTADDFADGGRAAVCGGITSHVDFAYQLKGETLEQAAANWHARADGKAIIDYGFHVVITDPREDVKAEVPSLIERGYTTFKLFMTFPGLAVDDGALMDLVKLVAAAGGRVSVHAENYYVSDRLIAKFLNEGRTGPRWHAKSRPWQSEYEATVRALALADVAGAPIYVVHMSSAEAVDALSRARSRGQEAIGETSISYLSLNDEVYDRDDFEPAKYVCSPPIRSQEDQDRLWLALQAGGLQVVGSDHDPFNLSDRYRLGASDFSKIPNGIAGTEQIRPLLWTEGVARGRLSLERFVAVTATNPARAFGMWPQKGVVAPGADADLVVWDPSKEVRLGLETTHSKADYCVYEGREVRGYAAMTISRGEIVARNGQVLASAGRGRFIKRGQPLHV